MMEARRRASSRISVQRAAVAVLSQPRHEPIAELEASRLDIAFKVGLVQLRESVFGLVRCHGRKTRCLVPRLGDRE
jgi:hypothetical protein